MPEKFNPAEHFRNLKGQDYLEVKWRLVWFRQEHPDWSISTKMLEHTDDSALFKATITEPHADYELATAHGSETKRDFGDFIEKAETKAIGRALAILGYGTQFAEELDEGDRIADAPVDKPAKKAAPTQPKPAPAPAKPAEPEALKFTSCEECHKEIKPYKSNKDGHEVGIREHIALSKKISGRVLCQECIKNLINIEKEKKNA